MILGFLPANWIGFFSLSTLFPLLLFSQPPASPSAALQVVYRARYLMPGSLQRLIQQREKFLIQGMDRVSISLWPEKADRSQDEKRLIGKMEALVPTLQGRADFSQVIGDFGEVAQLTLKISLPEGKTFSAEDLVFFLDYMGRQGSAFELVVYPAPQPEDGPQLVRKMLGEIQERRQLYAIRLQSAYPRPFSRYALDELNERSPFYGVAQLVYSHAVIDIARLWLWAWTGANGDLGGSLLLESDRPAESKQPVSPK